MGENCSQKMAFYVVKFESLTKMVQNLRLQNEISHTNLNARTKSFKICSNMMQEKVLRQKTKIGFREPQVTVPRFCFLYINI